MKNNIYIFGAHSRARTLAAYLQYLYPGIHIKAYFYDNDEKNSETIGDVPVYYLGTDTDISTTINLFTDYPVYIGTRGIYHPHLIEKLKQMGFSTIYPVTQEMDLNLRNQYLKKYYTSIGRKFKKIDELEKTNEMVKDVINRHSKSDATATVYVVKSSFDRPLRQEYLLALYEKEIYAGAVLAQNTLPKSVLTDASGDNISAQNKQFCELTALYWIWKHAGEDIIGLAHYRRHFLFPEDWKERMLDNHVDVILPVPLYVAPSIEENFKSRHEPSDWEFMMQHLKDNLPKDYQEACIFFKKNLYSPCNMFVMKREILDVLCTWLFPILFTVVDHGGIKNNPYLNRYPGFISERLISLFFEMNREKFNVVYADKNFLP